MITPLKGGQVWHAFSRDLTVLVMDGVQSNSDAANARSWTDAAAAAEHDAFEEDDDTLGELQSAFARAPARKSLGNNAALLGWLDAQERLQNRLDSNEVKCSWHYPGLRESAFMPPL